MKIRYSKKYGVPTIYFGEMVFLEFRCDWNQLPIFSPSTKWNWYHFDLALIKFFIEKDEMYSGWESEVGLLGFGLRLRWNTKPNEQTKRLLRRAEEMETKKTLSETPK